MKDAFPKELHVHRLWLLAELGKQPFSNLLDVGCGKGLNINYFQEVYPDSWYAGVDIHPEDIREGKEIYRDDPKVALVEASAENLPFDDNSFDLVLTDGVMMYVQGYETAARELMRVAKKAVILCERDHLTDKDYTQLFPGLKLVRKTEGWGDPTWETNGWIMRWEKTL